MHTHLYNLHVQQPQESTAEAKAHGIVDLGFEFECCVIQLQLIQRLTQVLQKHSASWWVGKGAGG